MAIDVRYSDGIDKFLKEKTEKYRKAANTAMKKAALEIYSVTQKVTTKVVDGVAVKRKGVRTTKRTTWPGLRRPTGNLARGIKMGVVLNGSVQVFNSVGISEPKDKFYEEAAVGIGNDVPYGVEHEREGRKQSGLQGGKNYFPFLLPALEKAKGKLKKIFDKEFRKANQ